MGKYKIHIVFLIIFIFGLYFRLSAYLSCKSVWLDEAFLFLNIYEKSYPAFFSVLDWCQSAPPYFLAIEKMFLSVFGIKEYSIRLFSLLCSIISLPVFYYFSRKFLKKDYLVIIANILFLINSPLIFYSQELKQYSLDVLSFMLLTLFLLNLSIKNFNTTDSLKYILVTIASPFISLISYFPIAAWVIREAIVNSTQFKNLKKLFIIQMPLIIMFVCYYITMLKPQKFKILSAAAGFWQQGYFTFNIHNDIKIVKNLLLYIFEPCTDSSLLLFMFFIGICMLIKNYKIKEYSLVLIILIVVSVISLLQLYPIWERASLFLIPIIIIILSMCFDIFDIFYSNKKLCAVVTFVSFLMCFLYCYHYIYIANRFKGKVVMHSNAKLMMQILKKEYKKDEAVIISSPARSEYMYYKLRYQFYPEKEIFLLNEFKTREELKEEVNKLLNTFKNCWFFYSFDYSNGQVVNNTLNSLKYNYKILDNSYILHLASDK